MSAFGQKKQHNPFSVYVGNLDYQTVPGDLDKFFAGCKPTLVRLVRDRETDEFRGYAYVDFGNEQDMEEALKRNGQECMGRYLKVNAKGSKPQGGNRGGFNNNRGGGGFNSQRGSGGYNNQSYNQNPVPEDPPFIAYVGSLPWEATEEDITLLFEGMEIESIRIITDRETGRSRGYSYVEFKTKAALISALDFNEREYKGRPLRVNVANQPKNRGNPFGSRGGHRGGFGGGSNRFQQQGSEAFGSRRYNNSNRGFNNDGNEGENSGYERRTVEDVIVEPTAESESARPRLNLKKRSEGAAAAASKGRSTNVFGSARPVDTSASLAKVEKEFEKVNLEKATDN